ncbi:Peptide/nickel transport system ATP-binding protein OS=Streptomyces albaduncus OX=68172 GN=FHS32_001481 PE=3 SV=1 [Streptomyces griseoloalbus]
MGLVPQSPAAHLTPVRTIRSHLEETVAHLTGVRGRAARRAAAEQAAHRTEFPLHDLDRHPHELSGGLAQRAATALALVGDAPLLLADEPTTGLDRDLVDRTVDELRRHVDDGHALLMITHDLTAAERIADRVAVMYAGRIVELTDAARFFGTPGPRTCTAGACWRPSPSGPSHPSPACPPNWAASPRAAPSPPAATAPRTPARPSRRSSTPSPATTR